MCSGKNAAKVKELGAVRVIDYQLGSFGQQLQSERCVDATIDFVGGVGAEKEGLAATGKSGLFITVVGPEKHVGERKLGPLGLSSMLIHILWRWVVSLAIGPDYRFVGPLAPDFEAIERLILTPRIRPVIDRVVPFTQRGVAEGIRHVRSHRATGKVVIDMESPAEN